MINDVVSGAQNSPGRTSSCRILQQLCIHMISRQLHIPHHRAADEAIFHCHLDSIKSNSQSWDIKEMTQIVKRTM